MMTEFILTKHHTISSTLSKETSPMFRLDIKRVIQYDCIRFIINHMGL